MPTSGCSIKSSPGRTDGAISGHSVRRSSARALPPPALCSRSWVRRIGPVLSGRHCLCTASGRNCSSAACSMSVLREEQPQRKHPDRRLVHRQFCPPPGLGFNHLERGIAARLPRSGCRRLPRRRDPVGPALVGPRTVPNAADRQRGILLSPSRPLLGVRSACRSWTHHRRRPDGCRCAGNGRCYLPTVRRQGGEVRPGDRDTASGLRDLGFAALAGGGRVPFDRSSPQLHDPSGTSPDPGCLGHPGVGCGLDGNFSGGCCADRHGRTDDWACSWAQSW